MGADLQADVAAVDVAAEAWGGVGERSAVLDGEVAEAAAGVHAAVTAQGVAGA